MGKKKRRTKEEIHNDVMEAIRLLGEDLGFSNVTFVGIAKKSNTNRMVLSDNYRTLDKLLSAFANEHRFWFHHAMVSALASNTKTDIEYVKKIISQLMNDSFNDKTISQILRWELAENSTTTDTLIQSQEFFYKTIYYNLCDVRTKYPDSHVLFALLIGGIYYIALIKDKSNHWGVDFRDETNRNKLLNMVNNIIDKMISDDQPENEVVEIARRFKAKGINAQIIAECTGLSIEQVRNL